MIISDIDYLDSISETSASYINGGGSALTISEFLAQLFGDSTNVITHLRNKAVSDPRNSDSSSSVSLGAVAYGDDSSVAVSASSASFIYS